MIVLGLTPKMGALVEALPTVVLGGAGIVMFGMVAATGIRILANVDFKGNRHNLYIVALSIGFGLIPLVAPRWTQQMAHGLHPLLESGILLTAVAAVVLNLFFNGTRGDTAGAIEAAKLHSARMLLQVHDELVFEVKEAEAAKLIKVARNVMEKAAEPAIKLSVPIHVDAKAADNWEAAH
mgnify:CR=1 FL=1